MLRRFDYRKLRGRFVEKCDSQKSFAESKELSERTVSLKLNNKVPFTDEEIVDRSTFLEIPIKDVDIYFFTLFVQNVEQNSGGLFT